MTYLTFPKIGPGTVITFIDTNPTEVWISWPEDSPDLRIRGIDLNKRKINHKGTVLAKVHYLGITRWVRQDRLSSRS